MLYATVWAVFYVGHASSCALMSPSLLVHGNNAVPVNPPRAPSENIAIYAMLYCIEVAVREFIISAMEARFGPKWWKQLPGDVLSKFTEGKEYERRVPWVELTPHHPLYYVDFPDLRKIIDKKDNWRTAFEKALVDKDVFLATLRELEPARNTIAHNRKATPRTLAVTTGSYNKLVSILGVERVNDLCNTPSLATDIVQQLDSLHLIGREALLVMLRYEPLECPPEWRIIREAWWWDSEYLGNSVSSIQIFFAGVDEYSSLPRRKGTGHHIEAWVTKSGLDVLWNNAESEFLQLKAAARGAP